MIPDDPTPPHSDNTSINLILSSTNCFPSFSPPRGSHLLCYKPALQPAHRRRGETNTVLLWNLKFTFYKCLLKTFLLDDELGYTLNVTWKMYRSWQG